ncbi:MAG: peptidase domain-containing ABC transporter [Phaeodactylibacter sp.]|nr:peptidase domain-containing ABC transporter [Phaeodactylibacter sp.]
MKSFPVYRQLDSIDCGPVCLKAIAKHYGRTIPLELIREKSYITNQGTSIANLGVAAEELGFRTLSAKLPFENLKEDAPLPLIAFWRSRHFVVVYKFRKGKVYVVDPAIGAIKYSEKEFKKAWLNEKVDGKKTGVALMLEPTPKFHEPSYVSTRKNRREKRKLSFFVKYLWPYRKYFLQIIMGLLIGSLIQLILPFLAQALVDKGINGRNLGFVNLILIAQVFLHFSGAIAGFVRSWIYLHLGVRINIAIISDFLIKVLKLPVWFFSSRSVGDLMQRIGDHKRIESFLTGSLLNIIFSVFNFFVFSAILIFYHIKIFLIFLAGSILYIIWILLFLNIRKTMDYKMFDQQSDNKNTLIELFQGVQEIKLQNCEQKKRWKWERIQASLFKTRMKMTIFGQYQSGGAMLINQIKSVVISYVAAKSVISGEITFGMMLAIQYILGQATAPIGSFVQFITNAQMAKISLERLNQIHQKRNEEDEDKKFVTIYPEDRSINLIHLGYQYHGPKSPFAIQDINIKIPEGKITAIVGASGSGKTTLIKLLLKFYYPSSGSIKLGGVNLKNISAKWWRDKCGAVLQDGYIFTDSIANNIAVNDDIIDKERLIYAAYVANIQEFIESLPMGYNTKIGANGQGISQGQKQRILIARAVYKDPDYLFFDEATNALDSKNEHIIMQRLQEFYKGRTVVVVAHRMSTVKSADQIIVLDNSRLIEKGTHAELVKKRGIYYNLIRNQLELH